MQRLFDSERVARRALVLALALLAGAAIAVWLELPGSSRANYFSDSLPRVSPYTFQAGTGCSINYKKDPVNLVFTSNDSASGNGLSVTRHIVDHTGWSGDSGSDQGHSHYGICSLQEHSRNSSRTGYDLRRFHWRMWSLPYTYTPGTLFYNVVSAHHEHISCANDQVDPNRPDGQSGFDYARDTIEHDMAVGGHSTRYEYFGNTENFKTYYNDCTFPDLAGSSGAGFVIKANTVQN